MEETMEETKKEYACQNPHLAGSSWQVMYRSISHLSGVHKQWNPKVRGNGHTPRIDQNRFFIANSQQHPPSPGRKFRPSAGARA